jgi:aminoglycoside phosphotransferase (APT) family kinase protein
VQLRAIANLVRLRGQTRPTVARAMVAPRAVARAAMRQAPLVMFVSVMAFLASVPALADPSVAEKRAEAQQVLAQVQQLDSSLAHAIQAYDRANERLNDVRKALRENTKALASAQRTLKGVRPLHLRERRCGA